MNTSSQSRTMRLPALERPTLVFVCACETDFDTRNELIGWFDPELTERGHEQASVAADKIVALNCPLHHIYAGRLWRMKQTAQHISETTDVNVTWADALNPWDVGELGGQEQTPDLLARLDGYRIERTTAPADGESFAEFTARWNATLTKAENYVREYFHKALVLVTDAENIRAATELLGTNNLPTNDYAGGSVLKIEYASSPARPAITCSLL